MAVIGGTPSPLAANLLCIAEKDKHLPRLKTANLHESGIGPKANNAGVVAMSALRE